MEAFRGLIVWVTGLAWGQGSQWFWVMLQSIVVIVTVVLIHRQVRLGRLENMLQTIHTFRDAWGSEKMATCRRITCANYLAGVDSIGKAEEEVLTLFEEIGFFVKTGVIHERYVWEFYSYYIEPYWIMLEDNIRKFRIQEEDKTWFEHFQTLRNRMRQLSKKRDVFRSLTKEDVEKFIRGERERLKTKNDAG